MNATVVNWPCEELAYSCCEPCVQLSGHPVPHRSQAVFNGALWADWIKHWRWAMVEAGCRKGCKHTAHKREWECPQTEQFVIVLLYFQEVCFSVSASYLNLRGDGLLQRFTLKTWNLDVSCSLSLGFLRVTGSALLTGSDFILQLAQLLLYLCFY